MVRSMYKNTATVIRKDRVNDNTTTEVNKGVWQGWPLSQVMFNVYTDKVTEDWVKVIKESIFTKDLILLTILFMDNQAIVASIEDEIQRAVYALNKIAIKYNLKITVNKTNTIAMNERQIYELKQW